jgi:hypothetical protein
MLRPATPESLDRLRRAATDIDRELDTALTCLGILPPLELQPIRECLLQPSTVIVAETNRDGHRLLSVRDRHGVVAWIHHDGRVVRFQTEVAKAV